VVARSHGRVVLRRFVRHRLAIGSVVVLALLALVAFLGPRVWHYGYTTPSNDLSRAPSWKHPFGTDEKGVDFLAQVLRGAQKSLQITVLVALFASVIGIVVGAVAGYFRGRVDALLMRMADLVLMVPLLAIAAVMAYRFSRSLGGWFGVVLALALFTWPGTARIVRAEFLSLREKEFVEAAVASGAGPLRIIVVHLLPNVVGPLVVAATLTMAGGVLAETSLSFLGLGVRFPDTSLGLIISNGEQAAQTRPWLFYIPGLVILAIVLCINFIGDGLRDAFDPKQQRVRA
jgi:peptide/nickel transport system permease protein